MEHATPRIIECRWGAHGRIDELEKLEADAVAGGEKGEFHFVQFGIVDAEDGGAGVHGPVAADGVAQGGEAEEGRVPCYSGFEVWDVQGDVVDYAVVWVGFECHLCGVMGGVSVLELVGGRGRRL